MSEYKRVTRSVKHEKRQKQKRKILFFSSLAILFLIVFISLILFGNKGNPQEASVDSSEEKTEEAEESTTSNATNTEDTTPDDTTIEPDDSEDDKEDIEIEEISSDDSNVKTAYKGDWDPIGTKQEGPHTINYNDGSDDRVEIKEAVVKVTELDENDMVEHWIGRGGDQAVIATVYNSSYEESIDEIYRVYLQWIDEEGWQPTKVEELKHLP